MGGDRAEHRWIAAAGDRVDVDNDAPFVTPVDTHLRRADRQGPSDPLVLREWRHAEGLDHQIRPETQPVQIGAQQRGKALRGAVVISDSGMVSNVPGSASSPVRLH